MPRAGRIIRAADLTYDEDLINLADIPEGSSVAGTWTDWGDPITFTNPGVPVTVTGEGMGSTFKNASGNAYVSMRVAISLTGGATWSEGSGPRGNLGWTTATRETVMGQHVLTGTATGDIIVKAQYQGQVTGTGYFNGTLKAKIKAVF